MRALEIQNTLRLISRTFSAPRVLATIESIHVQCRGLIEALPSRSRQRRGSGIPLLVATAPSFGSGEKGPNYSALHSLPMKESTAAEK